MFTSRYKNCGPPCTLIQRDFHTSRGNTQKLLILGDASTSQNILLRQFDTSWKITRSSTFKRQKQVFCQGKSTFMPQVTRAVKCLINSFHNLPRLHEMKLLGLEKRHCNITAPCIRWDIIIILLFFVPKSQQWDYSNCFRTTCTWFLCASILIFQVHYVQSRISDLEI